MKKYLLILLLLALLPVNAQTPIYGLNGGFGETSEPEDGINFISYVQYGPENTFDQSSAGFDQVWDISGFTAIAAYKYCFNTYPTASELSEFPGTSKVTTSYIVTSEGPVVENKTYSSNSEALTGYSDTGLTLNYFTDNANFGTFPFMYGDLHLDTVAGTYVFGAYSGTFEGTMITEVDAYGIMTTTDESPSDVTRLKTIETLEITYPGFGNVGTVIQTTYRYFRENISWPYVKSINRAINIPLLGIDTNTTTIEKSPTAFLSIKDLKSDAGISLFPNPASNKINIVVNQDQKVISLTVIDMLGKVILTKNETKLLDVSSLQKGTYFIKIKTDAGQTVKKFIKD